jgi:hypothetical protein
MRLFRNIRLLKRDVRTFCTEITFLQIGRPSRILIESHNWHRGCGDEIVEARTKRKAGVMIGCELTFGRDEFARATKVEDYAG